MLMEMSNSYLRTYMSCSGAEKHNAYKGSLPWIEEVDGGIHFCEKGTG